MCTHESNEGALRFVHDGVPPSVAARPSPDPMRPECQRCGGDHELMACPTFKPDIYVVDSDLIEGTPPTRYAIRAAEQW